VFTARYALSPYIKQIRFVFKGLKFNGNYSFMKFVIWSRLLSPYADAGVSQENQSLHIFTTCLCFRYPFVHTSPSVTSLACLSDSLRLPIPSAFPFPDFPPLFTPNFFKVAIYPWPLDKSCHLWDTYINYVRLWAQIWRSYTRKICISEVRSRLKDSSKAISPEIHSDRILLREVASVHTKAS
jgi:hypothetical protein